MGLFLFFLAQLHRDFPLTLYFPKINFIILTSPTLLEVFSRLVL